MSFKTYNEQGQVLLDAEKSVFSLVKSGGLTRLFSKTFAENKRIYWYRAKRLVVNSQLRQGTADIYTPEYCMYYIDVPNAISPIPAIHYNGLAKDCTALIYMNAGNIGGAMRLMFYSNGRLSDDELAKYQIYVFDVNVIKETQVGINLYDKDGNVTFSNRSRAMSVAEHFIYDRAKIITLPSNEIYQKISKVKLASITLFPYEMVNYGIQSLFIHESVPDEEWEYATLNEIHITATKVGYCMTKSQAFENIPTDGRKALAYNTLETTNVGNDGVTYKDCSNAYDRCWEVKNNPPYQGQALLVNIEGLPFPYN